MTYLKWLTDRWQMIASALVLAAIVHICTTFLVPQLYRADAYTRLARNLPGNSFVILPQAQPKQQVLPFQMPDARYAVCKYDLTTGPLAIQALLPEPGWSLSLYSSGGEGFYAYPANERRSMLNLIVLPSGERFLGHANDARHQDTEQSQVVAPAPQGIAVIRAPLKGRTFVAQTERELAQARCRQMSY